jgi:hypothetical protein
LRVSDSVEIDLIAAGPVVEHNAADGSPAQ